MAVKFVCVLALLIAATSTYASGIQGGRTTSYTTRPYYVSIEDAAGEHICGGALIGKDLVLSSTYCLTNYNAKQLFVRVGSGAVISITASYYNASAGLNVENDIGVIKLAKPITVSSTTNVIKVASSDPKDGNSGVVVALKAKNKLAEAPVTVITAKGCTKYSNRNAVSSSSEVCALSKSGNACNMSSGSPLVVNNELVGVVSWGYGCGSKGSPAVCMNVAAFKSWIESVSKKA